MRSCRACWTRAAQRSPARTANIITPARSTKRFLEFAGIDPEALKKELNKSDTEILEWITTNAKHKRTTPEIIAWTNWQENRAPNNPDGREYLNGIHKAVAPNREDILTWFDVWTWTISSASAARRKFFDHKKTKAQEKFLRAFFVSLENQAIG